MAAPDLDVAVPAGRRPGLGRLRARRVRLLVLVLAVIAALTVVAALLGVPALHAFGLGLLFPGAGLLYTGDLLLFVPVLAASAALAPRLISRGDYVSVSAVVLIGAALAAWRSDVGTWGWASWVVIGGLALAGAAVLARSRGARAEADGIRQKREQLVAVATPRARGNRQEAAVAEMTPDELALHRWMLDHALRPQDDWTSLDMKDQFSLKSVRYQLNFLQWSLALASASRTPAFSGYTHVAQRNLIERTMDPRVWSYWRWENRLGNLRASADPIARDNIMFSGYVSLMLGTYVATTGDRRYDEPGSLTFAQGNEAFRYDHETLNEAIEWNFRHSPYGLYACEPGFVFPLCNSLAMLGLATRDAQTGSRRSDGLMPEFLRGLHEEFTHPDGDVHFMLNTRLGFAIGRSPHASAQLGFFLHPLVPELSERWWTIARSEIVDTARFRPEALDGSGDPVIGDWGTGKPSHAMMYTSHLALARELGDDEAYESLLAAADTHLGWTVRDGVGVYENCSVNANALLGTARFGGPDAWRRLIQAGVSTPGPRLAEANYPEVLVARAASDGKDLQLVLHPGAAPLRTALHLDGLRPSGSYTIRGGVDRDITADGSGRAVLEVDLRGRTEISVAPRS